MIQKPSEMRFVSLHTQMTFSHLILHDCIFCSVRFAQCFTGATSQRCHFQGQFLLGLHWCPVLSTEAGPCPWGISLWDGEGWNHQGGRAQARWLCLLYSRALAAVNSFRCLGGSEGDLGADTYKTWLATRDRGPSSKWHPVLVRHKEEWEQSQTMQTWQFLSSKCPFEADGSNIPYLAWLDFL